MTEALWKHRDPGEAENREMTDRAYGVVTERVAGHEDTRVAVRDLCWLLQEDYHRSILANNRLHLPPDEAHRLDTFERGVAAGIEMACSHLTEISQIREVREWLRDTTKETT